MLVVTGSRTTIVAELRRLLAARGVAEEVRPYGVDLRDLRACAAPPPLAERYLFASGYLVGKRLDELSALEAVHTFTINALGVARCCESILRANRAARICIIGSASAEVGSYDGAYGMAKAALHHYVRTRRVAAPQSLACVAPGIIADSGMTRRRHDYPAVLADRAVTSAARVALAVFDCLYGPREASFNNAVTFVYGTRLSPDAIRELVDSEVPCHE